MLIIYGSNQCPDCVACRETLDKAKIPYEYRNISDDLRSLKEFLMLREREPAFLEVKAAGKIGIPCILREDGSVTVDWETLLSM